MTNAQKSIIGCLALAVLVVFVGGVIAFLVLVPEVTEQLPPGGSAVIVTLSTPSNDAQVPLNQFTSVSAEAVGAKPITALELWIDGTPSETKNPSAGASLMQFDASWNWTPARAGEHTLIVRAVDADHNTGMSNIVRVTVSKDAGDMPVVAIQTKPGDTIASLAQKDKTTPQQIIDLNPQINPSGTITPGETITIPIPTPPPLVTPEPSSPPEPPGNPNQPPANNPPNKYIIWWNHNILKQFAPLKPPAAPDLTASVGAGTCAINLYINDKSDNEDGFFVYQLDPNAFGFKRIATLDAHNGAQPIHYVDPVSTGKYLYYVSSFNAGGESPSKFAQAAIIEPCGDPQSSLQLNNAQLTVNQPVNKIYCYLQVDNGLWTRVPPGPESFITPSKPGEFDLTQYLKSLTPSPPPPQITLHLECWGWHGDTLIYLGEATETIKQGHVQLKAPSWQLIGNLAIQKQLLTGDYPDSDIAPPINVRLSEDPNECLAHAPPDPFLHSYWETECPGLAAVHTPFLIWDWSPNGCSSGNCVQKVDGYKVYILQPGQEEPDYFIGSSFQDQKVVGFSFGPITSSNPQRAIVRAFSGSSESADSNEVPLTLKQTTVELKPIDTLSLWQIDANDCSDIPADSAFYFDLHPIPAGDVVEGFQHSDDVCEHHNIVARGAVLFDTSKISQAFVSAHLKFKQVDSMEAHTEYSWNAFCPAALMLGTQNWRGNPWGGNPPIPPIPAENYLPADTTTSAVLPQDLDVTSAVKQWVQGSRPNYGFVLAGRSSWQERVDVDMGMGACEWVYGDFVLEVTDYAP